MPAASLDAFLHRLLATERAWADLETAEAAGPSDPPRALTHVRAAIVAANGGAQLLVRAAALLDKLNHPDEARATLAGGLAPGAPPAPLQLAYARSLLRAGEVDEARRWFRGAMLRARPDAALALELAELEQRTGAAEAATRLAAAARRLRCDDVAAAARLGRSLTSSGRGDLALIAYALAYARGYRDGEFLADYAALLDERGEGQKAPNLAMPPLAMRVAAQAAQARLAAACDRPGLVAAARRREASPAWLDLAGVRALLIGKIAAAEPFSWVRLSDGEARFVLFAHPHLRPAVSESDAAAAARLIWWVWFGVEIAGTARIPELAGLLDHAIAHADLLGVSTAQRLDADDAHIGYLACLERHLDGLQPASSGRKLGDAMLNYALNETDPFLAGLLDGLDFLGVVSPHPDLAAMLGRRFGIGRVASHDIPGEGRLDRDRERSDRGSHFPAVFERLLTEITVPRRGAVFLVAAGLLGKIYCDRIRTLGGIAIDIGAVADAWMGFDTRDGLLAPALRDNRLG